MITIERFSVPRFQACTEKSLQEKMISDQDRRYIVRTLATILMGHISDPKMTDCAIAAKALVAKYPFLGDTEGKPHFSWMKFISIRCSNVNRPDPDKPKPKKRKLDTKVVKTAKNNYPLIPPCDDISYERNMAMISKEFEKTKLSNEVLVGLMQQTFPKCQQNFKEAWLSRWSPAILKVAKADKIRTDDDDNIDVAEEMDELPEGDLYLSYCIIR